MAMDYTRKRIMNNSDYSDAVLVAKRASFDLLEIASLDDPKKGLNGEKEKEEIDLISFSLQKLAYLPDEMFNGINDYHSSMLEEIRKINDAYERARENKGNVEEIKRELIKKVIQNDPSRGAFINFIESVDVTTWGAKKNKKHYDLLTKLVYYFIPRLGNLIESPNDLTMEDVIETIYHGEINTLEDSSEKWLTFNKSSGLSKMIMKDFIHECYKNDNDIDNIERRMIEVFGNVLFDYDLENEYDLEELLNLETEMKKENKLYNYYSRALRDLDSIETERIEEEKVKQNIFAFMDIIREKAFEDGMFTSQENEIVERIAKYFGIRVKEDYNRILDYCKRKVIVVNGESNVSENLADFLTNSSITAFNVEANKAYELINYQSPDAVIVDLSKGQDAKNLIERIRETPTFNGFIFGIYKGIIDEADKLILTNEYKIDEFLPFGNASIIKDRVKDALFVRD